MSAEMAPLRMISVASTWHGEGAPGKPQTQNRRGSQLNHVLLLFDDTLPVEHSSSPSDAAVTIRMAFKNSFTHRIRAVPLFGKGGTVDENASTAEEPLAVRRQRGSAAAVKESLRWTLASLSESSKSSSSSSAAPSPASPRTSAGWEAVRAVVSKQQQLMANPHEEDDAEDSHEIKLGPMPVSIGPWDPSGSGRKRMLYGVYVELQQPSPLWARHAIRHVQAECTLVSGSGSEPAKQ